MSDLIDANFFVLAGPNISVTVSPSLHLVQLQGTASFVET
jgi:hypothetical protein